MRYADAMQAPADPAPDAARDGQAPAIADADLAWRLARKNVHIAFSNFAEAFYRMMSEPKSHQVNVPELNNLLIQNHVLASQITATIPILAALPQTPAPVREALDGMARLLDESRMQGPAGPADPVRHRRRAGGAGVPAQANDQGQPHDPPGTAGAGRAGARAGARRRRPERAARPARIATPQKMAAPKAAIFTTASQRLRACAGTPACRPTRPTRRRRNPPGRSPAALRAWRAGWRSAPSGRAPAWRGS